MGPDMTLRSSSLAWPVVVMSILLACGGSSGTGTFGGSALCGVNGSNECNANQLCDAVLGCVDCVTNTNCPAAAPVCLDGACVECASNANCSGATPACWPSDRQCHAPCTTSATCPQNASVCEVSTGDCIGCASTSDCPADAKICDAATQQCVECEGNADCPAGAPRCLAREGRCVQCLSGADCG